MANHSSRISIRNLESVVVVARSASIGKAAETLNVAQPALSQQLHLMEERLGVALLEPDARPFRLKSA